MWAGPTVIGPRGLSGYGRAGAGALSPSPNGRRCGSERRQRAPGGEGAAGRGHGLGPDAGNGQRWHGEACAVAGGEGSRAVLAVAAAEGRSAACGSGSERQGRLGARHPWATAGGG